MRSTEIVNAFWDDVWNAHAPDAVDRFVADDVVIEAGGQEISGKDDVKNWVKEFLDHVNDLHVETLETFENEDGSRVTSRWVLTGTNNGILGTDPNGKPIAMTGTAVWTVDDGQATARLGRAGLVRALPLPARQVAPHPQVRAGSAHASNSSRATLKLSANRHRSGIRSGQEMTPTFSLPSSDITVMFSPQP